MFACMDLYLSVQAYFTIFALNKRQYNINH